jgi:hypothetical protein
MLALTASYTTVQAQVPAVMVNDKTGWHKIGETTVNFKTERDEIVVLGADRFANIKFNVDCAPIYLSDIEIYYESGDKQVVNINEHVKAAGWSRIVDLNGGERNVMKIVFVYQTLPNRKDVKAHVEVWGLKTNTNR